MQKNSRIAPALDLGTLASMAEWSSSGGSTNHTQVLQHSAREGFLKHDNLRAAQRLTRSPKLTPQ